ncbi:hypothetical protein PIB30_038056 [Stylosanthes scabra]|uniref:Uncharacterized protein n=1 Tax=Stylosanthes scabra TaxID=79078 RepID=A0ABU6WCA5_9FABA|nr:hypothetical protein [Stylosanthes scabra]
MPKSPGALLESGIQITQRATLKADEPNSAAPPRTDHLGDEMHINIESFAKIEKSSKQWGIPYLPPPRSLPLAALARLQIALRPQAPAGPPPWAPAAPRSQP